MSARYSLSILKSYPLPRLHLPPQRLLWRSIRNYQLPMSGSKRPFPSIGGSSKSQFKRKKKGSHKPIEEGSHEAVLFADVKHLLLTHGLPSTGQDDRCVERDGAVPTTQPELPDRFSEIEITISELSSTGDGLGLSSSYDHVYVVPFSVPGDVVRAKVVHQFPDRNYTLTDFLDLIRPSEMHRDDLVRCPYFSKCGGCQLQMLPYSQQLKHKTTIIEKAYRNFSNLLPDTVPPVSNTIGSPLQYEYRTKLTPHFDGPPGASRRGQKSGKAFAEVPPIGFLQKGTRKTIDIEQCPIGTPAVQEGLRIERRRVASEISKYRKGATILLRETTERIPAPSAMTEAQKAPVYEHSISPCESQPCTVTKTYVTDNNATTYEYINHYKFANPAGAFFQNNNSILPTFTDWIREHILPTLGVTPKKDSTEKPITNLLDTYSGSGLFTITLSSIFRRSLGIDISSTSIDSALKNLKLNKISTEHANFLPAADASNMFKTAIEEGFDPDQTVVVIDPPRKGCDEGFITQLREFGPRRLCYVSCNVHTQARDVGRLSGIMDRGFENGGNENTTDEAADNVSLAQKQRRQPSKYVLEQLQGFDFFPQTGHVESVALLNRVDEENKGTSQR